MSMAEKKIYSVNMERQEYVLAQSAEHARHIARGRWPGTHIRVCEWPIDMIDHLDMVRPLYEDPFGKVHKMVRQWIDEESDHE